MHVHVACHYTCQKTRTAASVCIMLSHVIKCCCLTHICAAVNLLILCSINMRSLATACAACDSSVGGIRCADDVDEGDVPSVDCDFGEESRRAAGRDVDW